MPNFCTSSILKLLTIVKCHVVFNLPTCDLRSASYVDNRSLHKPLSRKISLNFVAMQFCYCIVRKKTLYWDLKSVLDYRQFYLSYIFMH